MSPEISAASKAFQTIIVNFLTRNSYTLFCNFVKYCLERGENEHSDCSSVQFFVWWRHFRAGTGKVEDGVGKTKVFEVQ